VTFRFRCVFSSGFSEHLRLLSASRIGRDISFRCVFSVGFSYMCMCIGMGGFVGAFFV
jgi:hypothetical protein